MYKKQTKTLKQKTLISSGTQDRKNMTSLEDKNFLVYDRDFTVQQCKFKRGRDFQKEKRITGRGRPKKK